MNRLHHLQETLPMNVLDCADNENVEFVILDYNSTDGLDLWMKNNLHSLASKVVYYKTNEPKFYNRSHSRNMAFRLATGDILINLDADNYAGKGFFDNVKEVFEQNQSVFIAPQDESLSDTFGKIGMTKADFLAIKGYDEMIKGYGFEDNDIKNRLQNLGRKKLEYSQPEFLKAITHTEEERIKNEFIYHHLQNIFVEKISHQKAKLLFVYQDNTYESAHVADSIFTDFENQDNFIKPLEALNRYFILDQSIEKGIFREDLVQNASQIEEKETIFSLINFYSQLTNKLRFMDNFHNQRIAVNEVGFGCGTVIKNFEVSNPIILS